MEAKKKRSPSYIVMFMLIVFFVALLGFAIWQWITVLSLYNKGQEDISEIKQALSELEKYASTEKGADSNAPALNIELTYPQLSSDKTDDLGETVAIVQNANSQALSTINNYLVIFSILITVVVLIVPLFNYWFLQKEQVSRLEKQYSAFDVQINNELSRMKKSIQQSTQVSFNVISGAMKENANVYYGRIEPVSDDSNDRAIAYYMNSDIFLLRNQPNCALREINNALGLEPNNPEYLNQRGVILHIMNRFEEAIRDKSRAIMREPNNARYISCRGVTFHVMKRYSEALEDHNKAVELDPNNPEIHYCRGATLHELQRYEEALQEENKAIDLEEDNAKYYHTRGITLLGMKHYAEAISEFDKALNLDPGNTSYLKDRDMAQFMLNE